MRVLIVNTLYPPAEIGGAERSVAQLAQGLAKADVETSVLTLGAGRSTERDRDGAVTVYRAPLRNLYWPYDGERRPAMQRAIWHGLEAANPLMNGVVDAVAAATRPDLIHLHLSTGFSLSVHRAAARRGLPLVQTLRDWSMMCVRASMFRRERRCVRRCVACVLATAAKQARSQAVDHVIGLSRPVLDAHIGAGYFRASSTSVIGNAASATPVQPRPALTDGASVAFGFMGRIEPEKGIEVLLRATAALSGDWRLWIAGRGAAAYVARLQDAYRDPRIVWLGQVEPAAFWRRIDVLVAPSVWMEPFGRVVVEAAQQGRGVIASRIGGLPEAAQAAGAAILTTPGDAADLSRALQQVLAAPHRWRAASPERAGWTEAAIVQAHRDVYRQVVESQSSRTAAEAAQS